MKIIVGKSYLTTGGFVAEVIRRSEVPTGDYLAHVTVGGVKYQYYYSENGEVANMCMSKDGPCYPQMTIVSELVGEGVDKAPDSL